MIDTDELMGLIAVWGQKHGIDNPDKQTVKLMEEVGELAHEISRCQYNSKATEDAIGDIGVVLIILADMLGYDFTDCLELAYNEIKDRTGKTVDGSFIKTSDEKSSLV
jgi:NTP pyrophosphatase (non-canonical NTP hydrolase)